MELLNSNQKKAHDIIKSGKDVFVTGGAGTGKTYLIRGIIEEFRQEGKQVVVCAPTGTAAINIGGSTIHQIFGYKKGPCVSDKYLKLILRAPKVIRSADVIIIDEVSMCRMDMMDSILMSIDKAKQKSGHNIQLILVGDFYQLPPVLADDSCDRGILEAFYKGPVGPAYAFQAKGWRGRFCPIVLEEIVRQKNGEFARNLNLLRVCNPACLHYFNQQSAKAPISGAVSIYATNSEVNRANRKALDELEGEEVVFTSIIKGIAGDVISEDYGIPSELHIKSLAEIVMTSNDMHGKYAEVEKIYSNSYLWKQGSLYYNGSMGRVLDIYQSIDDPMKDSILVLIKDGPAIWLKRQRYDIYTYVVDQNAKIKKQILCSIWQFPMKLAYAVTVHRGQGQTFECANIDPACKNYGQTYVAISRITDIQNLYLSKPLSLHDFRLNPFVSEFYEHLNDDGYIPSWEIAEKFETPKEETGSEDRGRSQKTSVEGKSKKENERDSWDGKKNGRPQRYPSGSKVVRVPNEIVVPLEKVLEVVCPKNGMDQEMLQKLIDVLTGLFDENKDSHFSK